MNVDLLTSAMQKILKLKTNQAGRLAGSNPATGFMTVYRIQSKYDRNRGAYSSLAAGEPYLPIIDEMIIEHTADTDGHPLIGWDSITHQRTSNDYCGCKSAADLLRWFKGYIPHLLRAGYEIVAFNNVKIVAIGRHQLLFNWID